MLIFLSTLTLVAQKTQIYSEIVGSVHYFGIELPHITLFLRHGGDFVGYLFGG